MPTYEYVCSACGHEYELFQKMTDPPAKKCPECKGKVKKKIGAGAGLIFKGSGFYITDYRSEGYKKDAKADAARADGGAKSDGSAPASVNGGGKSGAAKADGGAKSGSSDAKSGSSSGTKAAD